MPNPPAGANPGRTDRILLRAFLSIFRGESFMQLTAPVSQRSRRPRPVRPVRRPVRPRNADVRARTARRGLPRGQGRSRVSGRVPPAARRVRRPADRGCTSPSGSRRKPAARASTSSAKTSTTPAPTRSTTPSARRCSRSGMGKKRVIAETGAGMHGVATATAAALFGLTCRVYMGSEDVRRQELNVFRMRAMGTEVFPVESGSQTLKDATNEAMREWMSTRRGHALHHRQRGRPAPVPDDGPRLPERDRRGDEAAVPGAGREAAGRGGGVRRRRVATRPACSTRSSMTRPWSWSASRPAAAATRSATTRPRSTTASPACCTAASATSCRTTTARRADVHSVSAGLDYPGVGPEHSYWHDADRVRYCSVTDQEALDAFHLCGRLEGILPALETAHAVGRGDADRGEAGEGRRRGGLLLRPRRQGLRGSGPVDGEKVTATLHEICDHASRERKRPE